eukprot:TRINITY_DN6173_c1_g1_i3.p1 TRINITY_DN6173_c1_g1~~TRINITY_DN6173_c1_g1_i3.p1  ORF type:complete len:471 (+),score=106.96 TRINITY_DN6173_c1_g1_i3:49-1461(+)
MPPQEIDQIFLKNPTAFTTLEDQDDKPQKAKGLKGLWASLNSDKCSVPAAVLNLVNTIVGAGILSLSFGVSLNGLILGGILIISMAFVSDYAITKVFVKAMSHLEDRGIFCKSIGEVAHAAFGSRGTIFVDVNVILLQLGSVVAYLVILSDVFPGFFKFTTKLVVMLVSGVFFVIPLTLPRSISALKYGSFLSICFILAFTTIVLVQAPRGNELSDAIDAIEMAKFDTNIFRSLPIFGLAFNCLCNVVAVYGELKVRTPQNISKAVHCSTGICCGLYLFVGLVGYITYGEDTNGDLLINFAEDHSIWVTIVRIAYSCSVMLTIPLCMHPARASLCNLIFRTFPECPGALDKKLPTLYHFLLTVFLVGICLFSALVLSELDLVFGLVGATSSVMISYLIPVLILMKVSPTFSTIHVGWKARKVWLKQRAGRFLLFILGFIILVTGTIFTLFAENDDGESTGSGSGSGSSSS